MWWFRPIQTSTKRLRKLLGNPPGGLINSGFGRWQHARRWDRGRVNFRKHGGAKFVRVMSKEPAQFSEPSHGYRAGRRRPVKTRALTEQFGTVQEDDECIPASAPSAKERFRHFAETTCAQLGMPIVPGKIAEKGHGKFVNTFDELRLCQQVAGVKLAYGIQVTGVVTRIELDPVSC